MPMPDDQNRNGASGGEGSGEDLGDAMRMAANAGEEGEGDAAAGAEGDGQGGEGAPAGGEGDNGGAEGDGEAPRPLTASEHRALMQEISELRSIKEEWEQQRAGKGNGQEGAKEPPKDMTDEDWARVEARAGFVRTKVKNEATGEMEERMGLDPRKTIEFVSGMVEHGIAQIRQEFETLLHDNVASLRRQDVFGELEKDPSKEFSDIRQFSKAISDYLTRYPARDRTNPKYIKDAYWWAKGRGLRDVVKKIENNRQINKRVVHPNAGSSGRPGADRNGQSRVPAVAGAFLDKFDKQ